MKWLIVEDALRDRKGHWLEYVVTFVRGLTALGDEVEVLCDRKAEGFILEQTGAWPVLPESIWHRMGDGAGALRRYARVPGHAIATFVAMRRFFRGFCYEKTANNTKESNHGFHGYTRIEEEQGLARGTRAGAAFSNPSTSELARDSENTAPIRSADGPASSLDAQVSPLDPRISATSSPPDWIFVPTVLVHHLLGWWLLIKSASVPKGSRVLLFFPNLPIRLDDSSRSHWFGGPTTKLMAWLFGQLRKEVESGRVVLGVETLAMRRALESLICIRAVYLPHPVEAAKPLRRESGGLRTDLETLNADSLNNPPSAISYQQSVVSKPIIFGCYGAARSEKGSDIFQAAIKLILKNEVASEDIHVLPAPRNPLLVTAAGRPLCFAIQWVEDFRDEEGNLVSIDSWLREHPQVEVIGRYFQGDEYEQRLGATDVMVLPYRSPYRLRVSRVVIEAMIHGMPVIATKGTTLYEQAEAHGVAVGCEEGSAESLACAIFEIASAFSGIQEAAMQKAHKAAESFSVGYFRELLQKN